MKFKVTVSREWIEYGEVIVEAEDDDEARELVKEMLTDGDETIEWFGNNMEERSSDIESCEQLPLFAHRPAEGE